MANIWLREFMANFKAGYSLNEVVHLSNRKVGEYDHEIGRFFHDPAGWAAMHLYGNPNIFYKAGDETISIPDVSKVKTSQ